MIDESLHKTSDSLEKPNVEINPPNNEGQKSGRRLSIFQKEDSQQAEKNYVTENAFEYPPDYRDKLTNEIKQWTELMQEQDPNHYEKEKQRLRALKLDSTSLLTDKQLDFLSDAIDFDKYIKTVTDFINKQTMAKREADHLVKYEKYLIEISDKLDSQFP